MFVAGCTSKDTEQKISDSEAYVRVSEKNPYYFELSNGSTYIPIGLNLVGAHGTTEEGLAQMEDWMIKLSENGGNYTRIWLGHRFWNLEQEKAGEFDPESMRRTDSLFAIARRHGIRLKLCLESFRSIHPDNVGKKGRFPLTMYHVSEGGPFNNMDEYINTEKGKQHFLKKMDWYYERYGSDPIVFGWELWNEMDAIVADGWEDWTVEMLAELDNRFLENLVMQSLGSYDRIEKRPMYKEINKLPGNEVGQVHRYLDLGAEWEICHAPMDVLAADAVNEMIRFELDKPIIHTETGGVEPNHTGPIRYYEKDTEGMLLHDILFAPFFTGAAGPGHTWHWGAYVDENDLWYHFDRFSQFVDGINPAEEDFQPLLFEKNDLKLYALEGNETILVWLRDKNNTWRSELENGIPPQEFSDVTIDFDNYNLDISKSKIEIFDSWKNEWKSVTVKNNSVELPEFSRSILIRAKSE